MTPRIAQAEVLSFRLEVPLRFLERLPDEVGPPPLEVQAGQGELTLRPADGQSSLRFSIEGPVATLLELALVNDERGLFFQRVVGALMVRYRGDLHVRLKWNLDEKNRDGAYTEVFVRAGVSSYPGLSPAELERALGHADAGLGQAASASGTAPSPEEDEVERLLARAKADWAQYLRLKGR